MPLIRLDNGFDLESQFPTLAENPYHRKCGDFESAWIEADSLVEWLDAWLTEVLARFKSKNGNT